MGIIDVHAHMFPRGLGIPASGGPWPRLEIDDDTSGRLMIGDRLFRRVGAALWDVGARLVELDRLDIDLQVVSPVPVTLDVSADGQQTAAYLRSLNEGISAAVAEAPGRLLGLGAVPFQDMALAVPELEHLMGDLGLAGVEIGAAIGGRELDDPVLLPFFEAAASLGALVYVHPLGGGDGAIRRTGQPYDFGLGMLTDTAMAASALVFGGVLDACPELQVVMAHGCGTFPWAFPRLSSGAALGGDASSTEHEVLIRRLWVDTLVFDAEHLGLLTRRFGADHVLFGSDHPFIPGQLEGARDLIADGIALGGLTRHEATGILRGNALTLLGLGAQPDSVRG